VARKTPYRERLKKDFEGIIASLDLQATEKHFLRLRWLDQVVWMEGAANAARNRYYFLRLTTVVGGVIVPALISLSLKGHAATARSWVTIVLSLIVALSAAVEEFFHYGERWRHYRRTAELLKEEGWQFFQSSGPYRPYRKDHERSYAVFADRIENLLKADVDAYIKQVVQDKSEEAPAVASS
jgi:Protein of unknown function (DUF4231)